MRTTLTLTVDEETARVMTESPAGFGDPSALINKLIHEDMARKGVRIDPTLKSRMQKDDIAQTVELFLDENTHAGG